MPTISVTEARSNLYKLLEEVNETSSPLLITNKNGKNCYLIGEEDFNALLERAGQKPLGSVSQEK